MTLSLLQILRVVFLVSLGLSLLIPSRVCAVVAGVTAFVLALLILTGAY